MLYLAKARGLLKVAKLAIENIAGSSEDLSSHMACMPQVYGHLHQEVKRSSCAMVATLNPNKPCLPAIHCKDMQKLIRRLINIEAIIHLCASAQKS